MNQFIGEFTGKTVEEATQEGLRNLGLEAEEAEVEVLEEGKKKLFGSVKARVRISKKATDGERAVAFLDGLFEKMGITATSELEAEDEKIRINITTMNSGAVIGRKGEILDSLQSLAGAVANTGRKEYRRVVVDCENYRASREEALKNQALRLAEKAVATAKRVRLEPMNPYERRIVHAALADSTEVKTTSEGKEPSRRVVIIPNNWNPESEKKFRGNDRKGGKRFDDKKPYRKDRGERNRGERDRKDGKYGRDRDRRSSDYKKDVRKPAPFFGTYLGKSDAAKQPEPPHEES